MLIVKSRKYPGREPPQGEPFEMLEPCEGKLSRTVLRGESGCKARDLPDRIKIDGVQLDLEKFIQHITFRLKNNEQVEENKLELKRQWYDFQGSNKKNDAKKKRNNHIYRRDSKYKR